MKDLMAPRVIVTNYYPDSPFEVGDVLVLCKNFTHRTGGTEESITQSDVYRIDNNIVEAHKVEKATICFRPLAWYEKRDINDMPEYVKFRDQLVCKVVDWDKGVPTIDRIVQVFGYDTDVLYPIILRLFLPATQSEYEAYIKNKTIDK